MYDYKTERAKIFTEEGQRMFLSIRDNVKRLVSLGGAVTMERAISGQCGSSWHMMACVDRLVELGEIREIPTNTVGQHRVFMGVSQ